MTFGHSVRYLALRQQATQENCLWSMNYPLYRSNLVHPECCCLCCKSFGVASFLDKLPGSRAWTKYVALPGCPPLEW